MIIILSPAKSLDTSKKEGLPATQPRFLDKSEQLVEVLRKKKPRDLKKLMDISDKLAETNVKRFEEFSTPFDEGNAKQSILLFKGDVYIGLQADDFSEQDLEYAQYHVRILSGLYGLLRPQDLIQPYRLEMGTPLRTRKFKDLYKFWGEDLTDALRDDLRSIESEVVVNLASQEYYKALQPKKLGARIIDIEIKEWRKGKLMFVSFNAKKARGMMTRYAIKNRLTDPEQLKEFDWEGYAYDAERSEPDRWLFAREG